MYAPIKEGSQELFDAMVEECSKESLTLKTSTELFACLSAWCSAKGIECPATVREAKKLALKHFYFKNSRRKRLGKTEFLELSYIKLEDSIKRDKQEDA
jgi:hypothetical protein